MFSKMLFFLTFIFLPRANCLPEEEKNGGNGVLHVPRYKYEQSYKNYPYRNLSNNAREIYFAIGIHPSCVEKKGRCIPRAKCIGLKMLYLSRICYRWDLVCCYEDFPLKHYPFINTEEPKIESKRFGVSDAYERLLDPNETATATDLLFTRVIAENGSISINQSRFNVKDVELITFGALPTESTDLENVSTSLVETTEGLDLLVSSVTVPYDLSTISTITVAEHSTEGPVTEDVV